MKVLFLSRLFYPHIGGVEKHALKISEQLVKKGHEVTVLTEKLPRSYSNDYHLVGKSASSTGNKGKVKIIRIDSGSDNFFKKFRIWKELYRLRKVIKEADIIHCHDVFFWYLPFKFIYPFKPVFTTFHGYEGNNIPNKKAVIMHRMGEFFSNGNICIGEFFKKWYGTKPTYISYGAVGVFKNKIKKQKNQKIMYLGRLEEEAGIMEYLKALKVLKEKGYEFRLDVFGDGSQKRLAERYIKQNKLNVKIKGFYINAEKYIKDYDYIFVSRYLGILEALANKKLIFATYNNKIKKDYLEMTPFKDFIYICEDYIEVVRKFEHSLINSSEENIGIIKGYSWVKNQTWEKLTNLYLKLWSVI